MIKVLEKKTRKQAFLQLVRLQDSGYSVSASQLQIAARFQITVSLLRMIEWEGLRYEWPPLADVRGDVPIGPGCTTTAADVSVTMTEDRASV